MVEVLPGSLAEPAAPDNAAEDRLSPELRDLLALTQRHWEQIRSVEGEWEFQRGPWAGGSKQVVRFAYRPPNLFREEVVEADQEYERTLTVGDGKTWWTFSPFRWSVTQGQWGMMPAPTHPQPLLTYTPGAADLTWIASCYRHCSLMENVPADEPGVRVVEFSEPMETTPSPLRRSYERLRFRVDGQTGTVHRILAYSSFNFRTPAEEYVYEDWLSVEGATLAQRVRQRYSGSGGWEPFVYRNLRVNQPVPEERFRFDVPPGAAVLPFDYRDLSLRAARRYLEQHPDDAAGHAHYAWLLLLNVRPGEKRQQQGLAELRKTIELAPEVGLYRADYARQIQYTDPDEAERQLEAAVQACPQATSFWKQLAEHRFQRRDFQGAEEALRQGVEHTQPDSQWTDSLWIDLYVQQGKTDSALEFALAVWQRTGRILALSHLLYQLATRGGATEQVVAEYRRLLEDPALSDELFSYVCSRLLEMERKRGGETAARSVWRDAFQSRPVVAVPVAFSSLSNMEYRELLPEIASRLEKEVQRQPQDENAKLWLARTYRELGRREEATRLLEEVSQEVDDLAGLWECVAEWTRLGHQQAAWEAQRAFLKRHPEWEQTRHELFSDLFNHRRYQEALEVYGDPLEELRGPPRYYQAEALDGFVLGCYLNLGRLNELADQIRRELERQPDSFALRLALGDVQNKAGNAEAARNTWLELTQRANLSRGERRILVHRLEQAGALEAAMEQLIRATEEPVTREERFSRMASAVFPDEWYEFQCQTDLLSHLARLQEQLGKADEAQATRQRIETLRHELGVEDYDIPYRDER
jgi:tetratricopeptide (TPR) repeat protein/outer membrane lipoprotein-sorting protein